MSSEFDRTGSPGQEDPVKKKGRYKKINQSIN